jgi:type III pantothenate kinase
VVFVKYKLAIDMGNTNITVGLFGDQRLIAKAKTPTHASYMYERFFRKCLKSAGLDISGLDCVIISSVVPIALSRLIVQLNRMAISAGCDKQAAPRICIAGKDFKVPIKNMYRNKKEVGQDRLVNAFAAGRLYGAPCVVVDFGTAITFDIVSAKGEYLGGLILPGIELSLSSLYRKTALLPRVELKAAASIIGKDTVSSMRGGILFGFGAMCDGLTAQYRRIIGARAAVIATGGNAELMKRYAKSIQVVDDDLTLKGLELLSE